METLKSMIKESRRTVPVGAIQNGTVIDHVTVGAAIQLLRLLRLDQHPQAVTIGLRLFSKSMQVKDVIKIEGWEISRQLAEQIAVFSPSATISIIRNFQVAEKYVVTLPKSLMGVIKCPNSGCITNHEPCKTEFAVEAFGKKVRLRCQHCERLFMQNDITPQQMETALQ